MHSVKHNRIYSKLMEPLIYRKKLSCSTESHRQNKESRSFVASLVGYDLWYLKSRWWKEMEITKEVGCWIMTWNPTSIVDTWDGNPSLCYSLAILLCTRTRHYSNPQPHGYHGLGHITRANGLQYYIKFLCFSLFFVIFIHPHSPAWHNHVTCKSSIAMFAFVSYQLTNAFCH